MAKSMHYCRFRNALRDLYDVETYLREVFSPDDLSSAEETAAYDKVIAKIVQLAEEFG